MNKYNPVDYKDASSVIPANKPPTHTDPSQRQRYQKHHDQDKYTKFFNGRGTYYSKPIVTHPERADEKSKNNSSSHQSSNQSSQQYSQQSSNSQRNQQDFDKYTKLFNGRGTYNSKPIVTPPMKHERPENRRPFVNVTPHPRDVNRPNKGAFPMKPSLAARNENQFNKRPISKSSPPKQNSHAPSSQSTQSKRNKGSNVTSLSMQSSHMTSQSNQSSNVTSRSNQSTLRRTPRLSEEKEVFNSRKTISVHSTLRSNYDTKSPIAEKYSESYNSTALEEYPESYDSRARYDSRTQYDDQYPESYDQYSDNYDRRTPYDEQYPDNYDRGASYDQQIQYPESYDRRASYGQQYPDIYDSGGGAYGKQNYSYEPQPENVEYIDLTKQNNGQYLSSGNKYSKSTPHMSYKQDYNYMQDQAVPAQQDFYYQDQSYSPQFQDQNFIPQNNNYIQLPQQQEDYMPYQQQQTMQYQPQMQYIQHHMPQQQYAQQMQYPQQYTSPQYYPQMQAYMMNQQTQNIPQLTYVQDGCNELCGTSLSNCNKCKKPKKEKRHVEYGPCGEEIEVIHRDTVYVSRDDPCAEQFVQVPDTTPQYPMNYQPVVPSSQPVTFLQEMPQEQLQVVQLPQQQAPCQQQASCPPSVPEGNVIVCEPCELGLEQQCLTGHCKKPYPSRPLGPFRQQPDFYPPSRRPLCGNKTILKDGPPDPTLLPTIYKSLRHGDHSNELMTYHDRYGKSQRSDYNEMSNELWADYFHDLKMQNLRENEYDYGFSEDFVNNNCERNDRGYRRPFTRNRKCLEVPGTEYLRNDPKVRIESRNNIVREAEEMSSRYRVNDTKTQNWPADLSDDYDNYD